MNRIETLLERMTLEEKLGQLTMTACSQAVTGPVIAGDSTDAIRSGRIGNLLNLSGARAVHAMQRLAVEESRLRIPLLIGLDVIHGHRTLFPIPLAEAALFDPQAWELSAREAACEAAADGLALTFAPMLDVSRDPRWGRTAEGPGEDPWLAACFARAKVRGLQGASLAEAGSIAACAKHFCAYGAVTAGREYASVDISERTLREVHLPAFAAAVQAGVATLMPAFTDIAGVPMTAHRPLLRECLRGELGFAGVLISDYHAIAELMRHGVAADLPDAAALALQAGVDIDMMSDAYRNGLPVALARGRVTAAEIDESVRRVLRLKEQLGLFDDPYRRGASPESPEALLQRRRQSRAIAARSLVLLKNDGRALPLPASLRRLALIGPLADATAEMRGPWCAVGEPAGPVSLLAALRDSRPELEVRHAAGVPIDATEAAGIPEALECCDGAQAILLCLGEAAGMSGEAASRADPVLPGRQRLLAESVLQRARAQRTPVIAILFSGRPLIVPWLAQQADALLAAWFPGSEAGHALLDVLSGRIGPVGRTPMSWPRALGQVPIFFGQRQGGRPADPKDFFTSKYLDVPNEPLYPFGHGLSYTRFRCSNLRLGAPTVRIADSLEVQVDVSNEGDCAGEETLFLFMRDPIAAIARPVLELRGWTRIALAAGESSTASLRLAASDLGQLGAAPQRGLEPGEIELLVGPCADRTRLLSISVRLEA